MKKQNIFSGLRDFIILWSSQAVSTLGTAMTSFALIVWVYEQKGTASSYHVVDLFACPVYFVQLYRRDARRPLG